MTTDATIKDEVRKRYAKAAVRSQEKSKEAADGGCCGGDDGNKVSSHLYTTDEIRDLPAGGRRRVARLRQPGRDRRDQGR